MGSEAEPAKLLLPYLQRADELQKHEPLVAYYCRLYAMERGLKIPAKERTKTTSALLVSLIKQLEKDKKSINLGPEDNLYVEGFASNVFAKADKQDRAGRADLNTAKTFYAASIFFEILIQFGEFQPEIEQKQKYAVWKAADIRKALKEGRRPEPGPPGGDDDLSTPSSSSTSTYGLGPSQSFHASQLGGVISSQHADKDIEQSESIQARYQGDDISSQYEERVDPHVSPREHTTPASYENHNCPSNNFHQSPPVNGPEVPSYHETNHHHSYSSEQPPMPQNYYAHENPTAPYFYPNFQSYPSLNDSTFPAAPTHQPSYYHGSDASYSNQSTVPKHQSAIPCASHNANYADTPAPPVASYNYDSNYQPPVETIAEAHKAARFAVGALAFDDVPVAVDFLRRSLELLTNPSA